MTVLIVYRRGIDGFSRRYLMHGRGTVWGRDERR